LRSSILKLFPKAIRIAIFLVKLRASGESRIYFGNDLEGN
jgi:hypothetical protein